MVIKWVRRWGSGLRFEWSCYTISGFTILQLHELKFQIVNRNFLSFLKEPACATTEIIGMFFEGPCDKEEKALVMGFGVTQQGSQSQPCEQMQVVVTKYTMKQCQKTRLPREDSLEPTVFCAGSRGKDSCQVMSLIKCIDMINGRVVRYLWYERVRAFKVG